MTSAPAYYLGPHGTNGETIFVSLDLPTAVKFVSFQSEFTSTGTPLSINEVRFLQGRSQPQPPSQPRMTWQEASSVERNPTSALTAD